MTPIVSTPKAGAATLSRPLPRETNPGRRGPIVLATDATGMGGVPILAARLLAARLDVSLEVVTVLDPPMPYSHAVRISR